MEAPQLFVGGYFNQFSPENLYSEPKPTDDNIFAVDDLLDFSKADEIMTDAFFDNVTVNSAGSSSVTVVDSCNSSGSDNVSCRSFADSQFSGDLCVPYEDLAELEWLSNFVDESFSSDEMQNLQLISGAKAPTDTSSSVTTAITPQFRSVITTTAAVTARNNAPMFRSDVSVPGKARSKRSRAAPCDWSSRLQVLSPATSSTETANKSPKTPSSKKRETPESTGRRCLHCASEKTPQWRTGPMGPKTLCNACGVRYKSGRLVAEYRPAASPTFVPTRHSNSHRKVLELRRQNDTHHSSHHPHFLSHSSTFGLSDGDDYLIHYHNGPDLRHVI